MEFGKRHDTTNTTDFCLRQLVEDLLRTCYGEVDNLLWTCYRETGVMDFGLKPRPTGLLFLVCIYTIKRWTFKHIFNTITVKAVFHPVVHLVGTRPRDQLRTTTLNLSLSISGDRKTMAMCDATARAGYAMTTYETITPSSVRLTSPRSKRHHLYV